MPLTPNEQRDVEQALVLADALNEHAISRPIKYHARIQFIAHIIAAIGIARANNIDYRIISSTVRKMYQEMSRTERELRKGKPKLRVVPGVKIDPPKKAFKGVPFSDPEKPQE